MNQQEGTAFRTKEHSDSDNASIHSIDNTLSEYVEWCQEINAKRYKAHIEAALVKRNTYKERANKMTRCISTAAEIVKIRQTKLNKQKKLFVSLAFATKTALDAALKVNIPGAAENSFVNLQQAPVSYKSHIKTNKQVLFWDILYIENEHNMVRLVTAKFETINHHRYI